jgi:site-specific DNA-cytosine methylase
LDDPSPTLVASANQIGIVQPSALFTPFISLSAVTTRGPGSMLPSSVCASTVHHALVQPAALVRLLGDRPVKPLDAAVPAQTTGEAQNLIVSPSPFLVQYYGTGSATDLERPVPTVPTIQQHALVEPGSIDVEDCYFRMMTPPEIGSAMAFPGSYTVLGTNGQQIKQYGNAVTPPAMALLIERVVQSITGERAA